ncbi:MAG TPA: SMP-30/gluconolactonase/LRE family protein, partial [Bryobacteraceae bacterium]|nr:SMP-30/gluconolactonase/LRE family protein [Bryobacteraceae bacterium]
VPAQYDGSKPACVMVYQDGAGYVSETGGSRATIVMDNLIADGSMPVTVGIFVDPGVTPGVTPNQMARYHRSLEYDGIGDKYARFLIEDLIPEAEARAKVKISANPDDRGLIGGSSGGIAAFNAAWERPDSFHRVISYIGSFTNLRGADGLADLIRKYEPKPLRIFMQDGSNDQSIYSGSWFQANQQVFDSLAYSGYDAKFVIGTEGHSGRHGASILPEALRWVWREYPQPITASKGGPGSRHYITDFLDPDSDWQLVGQGYGSADAIAVDKAGVVYFADSKAGKIFVIPKEGRPEVFKDNAPSTGLMFGPDGRLYAAQQSKKRIVSYAPDGSQKVVAQDVEAQSLAITSKGRIYFTEPAAHRIWLIDTDKKRRVVFQNTAENTILSIGSLRLSPDEHLVNVTDRDSRWVWSMQLGPDNSFRYPMPFHHLEAPDDSQATDAAGMAIDDTGHMFVATKLGIQICDQPGRVVGIVLKPQAGPVNSVAFGGEGLHTLYATTGDKVFARKMRRTGTLPFQPVKLPRPQL